MTTPPPTLKPLNARRVVLIVLGATAALGLLVALSVVGFAHAKVRPPRNQPDRYAQFLALMDEHHPPHVGEDEATKFYEAFLHDASSPLLRLGAPGQSADEILNQIRADTQILWYAEWNDPTHASARAALTRALPMLDVLAPVVAMARMRPLDDRLGGPHPGMLEHLHYGSPWAETTSGVWRLAHLNNFAIADAAERGAWDETILRLRVSRAIAGHLGGVPHSQTLTGAMHTEFLAGAEAVRAARLPHADLRAVEMLLREMEQAPRFPLDPSWWMEGEALVVLDIAHERYTGRSPSLVAMLQPGFGDFSSRVDRLHAATERWMVAPPASRGESPSVEDFFENRGPHAFPPSVVDHWIAPDFPLLVRAIWHAKTTRAGALAALRVERYRHTHARLPATLADAMTVAQTLDPVSGEPFEYEITPEGKSYRLLSPPGARHLHQSERDPFPFVRPPIPEYITGTRPDPLAIPGEQPQP